MARLAGIAIAKSEKIDDLDDVANRPEPQILDDLDSDLSQMVSDLQSETESNTELLNSVFDAVDDLEPSHDTPLCPPTPFTEKASASKDLVHTLTSIPTPLGVKHVEMFKLIESPEDYVEALKYKSLKARQEQFLRLYLTYGVVSPALASAGVTWLTYEKWLRTDNFRTAMMNATSVIADKLEAEGIKRAMKGSDKLLLKFLESTRPEKFARKTLVSGTGENGEIEINVKSWAELSQKATLDTTHAIDVTPTKNGDESPNIKTLLAE